jgi:hypothetical protein
MRVSGRVLVRETGTGVSDVVVAAFDRRSERPLDVDRRVALREVGAALGSTLTDAAGRFELVIERRPNEARPLELVLAVLAPEDSSGPERPFSDGRVLVITMIPRATDAPAEAYVLRVTEAQLHGLNLGSTQPDADVLAKEIDRRAFAEERESAIADGVRRRRMASKSAALSRRVQIKTRAKTKFESLSRLTPDQRKDPQRVDRNGDITAVLERTMAEGLARVANARGPLPLPSDPVVLARMGLRVEGDSVEGDLSLEAWAAAMVRNGQDLTRSRTLTDIAGPRVPETATNHAPGSNPLALVERMTAPPSIQGAVLNQLGDLMGYEPGAKPTPDSVRDELASLAQLGRASAADADAIHDFHVLKLAWKDLWTQLFDSSVKDEAAALYEELVIKSEDETGSSAALPILGADAVLDVAELRDLVGASSAVDDSLGMAISFALHGAASGLTPALTADQQAQLIAKLQALRSDVLVSPDGARTRLERLVLRLSALLHENYAFDVFKPGACNFGLMLTYRQRWTPTAYQAGDLVATLPLAPGESRKYSKKQSVKRSVAETISEKAMTSGSDQQSSTRRADAEIMRKVDSATNFKLSAEGKVNVGIASITASSHFERDQKNASANTKKDFHEATMKAAREYKNERSVEVSTKTEETFETSTSAEISNPNNEITVTYLFYELERRYAVASALHRVRPVILVAQNVPAPNEIDEAWLIAHHWILNRVLLDDSFRPALFYLSGGMAGDEASLAIKRAHWEAQKAMLAQLEGQLRTTLSMRDELRETLVKTAQKLQVADEMPTAMKVLSLGLAIDPAEKAIDVLEASRKAAETRLQYVEQALEDAQRKAGDAATALDAATKDYAAATQAKFDRHVAIDQLRVHVKQNVLYYMQAVWTYEPPDQRYFRLYTLPVKIPVSTSAVKIKGAYKKQGQFPEVIGTLSLPGSPWPMRSELGEALNAAIANGAATNEDESEADPETAEIPPHVLATMFETKTLSEVADLDSPIGFKGNYVIFPLKVPTFITTFMMKDYIDEETGLRDPDPEGNARPAEILSLIDQIEAQTSLTDEQRATLTTLRAEVRTWVNDEIVVPTGQLFIEALPGAHPLLEEFKLRHRIEDVKKAQAEVRRAELENVRLAARILSNNYENPTIERRVVVGADPTVTTDV